MAFTDSQTRKILERSALNNLSTAEALIARLQTQLDTALVERDQARDRIAALESQRCAECDAPLCPRHAEETHCPPAELEPGWEAQASDSPEVF